ATPGRPETASRSCRFGMTGLTWGFIVLGSELRSLLPPGGILGEELSQLGIQLGSFIGSERLVSGVLVTLSEQPGQVVAEPGADPHPQGAPTESLGCLQAPVPTDQVTVGGDRHRLQQPDPLE